MRLSTIGLLLILFLGGCSGKESRKSPDTDRLPDTTTGQVKESNPANGSTNASVADSGNQSRKSPDTDRPPDTTTGQVKESNPANESTNASVADSGSTYKIRLHRQVSYGTTEDILVGKIATFVADDSNRVFILDWNQATIHVFDPEGSYLTSLGRKGRGPGEFGDVIPHNTMVIHSNRLYVTDAMNNISISRLHVFSLEDLSFSHTVMLIAENRNEYEELEGYYPRRMYPRNNGTFLVAYHRSPNEYLETESVIRYVVQDNTGHIVSGPIFEQKDLTYLVYEVRNVPFPYIAIVPFPFYGKSLLAVSDDGHMYAANNTEEFKIDVYDTNGKHIRTFQHPFNNRPLTRSGLIDEYIQRGKRVPANMVREAENLPESWPALETMFFDENRLWISTIVNDDEIYEWWVLEDTGEVITKFEWPRDEPIEFIRNGYLYTRETDEETGLEEIVRYRIEMEEI